MGSILQIGHLLPLPGACTTSPALTLEQARAALPQVARLPALRAGFFPCDGEVLVGRPQTKLELLEMVEAFPRVKANGVGHSWWQEQFCAGNSSDSINIVMTELNQTLE